VDEQDGVRRRRSRSPAARLVVEAAVVTLVWLVFAGSLAADEVVTAVLVGGGAAVAASVLRRATPRSGGVGAWLRHVPRIALGMLVDAVLVTAELVRTLRGRGERGRLHAVPFDVGDDAAGDVGRRVVTTLGITLQPNTIVVGFDRARQVVLVHELVPRPGQPLVPTALARRR
jgi:multisubunit Na+/H+ antiporter MnhE subunit